MEGDILNNLGVMCLNLREYRKTVGYCEQALVIAQEMNEKQKVANRFANLGNAERNISFHLG